MSRSMVTSRKARRAASAPFSIFSLLAPFNRSGWASTASREPNSRISSDAVFSPIPGTPGTLSDGSPASARRSATFPGGTPKTSSTCASPTVCSFNPSRTFTRFDTSWYMSLSEETITTSIPRSSARRDRVPMMSSASAPATERRHTPRASIISSTTGICAARSSGVFRRFALYSG